MLRGYAHRFCGDERGGLTVFVVVIFLLLLAVGGMAVDYQRYELARADLQDSLDRGVLAATNGNQVYDTSGAVALDDQAKLLVSEYMVSRDYRPAELNLAVSVTELSGGRQATASAEEPIDPIFLQMVGLKDWNVKVTVLMSDGANTKLHEMKDSAYSRHTPDYWDTHDPNRGDIVSVVDNSRTGAGDALLKLIN